MNATILLVDDSATHRSLIKVFLMGHEFAFLDADTGVAALALLEHAQVDLVIADVNMPEMDGFTFTRSLRAHADPRLRALPVVLLTSSSSETLGTEAKAAGANAYLRKPVSSAGIADVVEAVLVRSRRGG
jgi:two-component system chemotaxis response regulator CheY